MYYEAINIHVIIWLVTKLEKRMGKKAMIALTNYNFGRSFHHKQTKNAAYRKKKERKRMNLLDLGYMSNEEEPILPSRF